jgi:hypothetical protein
MCLIVQFRHFDPLSGKLPERYDWMFAEIAYRARKMLSSRSLEEINAGSKFLTELGRQPGYVNPHIEEFKQEGIPTILNEVEVNLIAASNEVEAVYKNVGNVSLDKCDGLPNAQWHELFAILSLSYLENVCACVHAQQTWEPYWESKWLPGHKSPNPFPRLTDDDINKKVNDWLVLAHQAIGFADALNNQEELVRKLRSTQNRQAITTRHAKGSGPLKAAVLELHKKYQSRSNREAARRIFEELRLEQRLEYDEVTGTLTFDDKVRLRNDDPVKRFEIWIGQSKKG